MILFLDSSAIVKLVIRERQTAPLSRYLANHADAQRLTSALARTEVVRAAAVVGAMAVMRARAVLSTLHQVPVDMAILDAAAILPIRPLLRSLDAIHVASAHAVAVDLRALITYDMRMAAAAEALGLPVVSPD